ncbi:MAG: aminomethyltransferase family protein [Chitinivibrionales bacterium]|nr:aminomethyltransferase family protein [Chitinivibrionales bacterium]
MHTETWLQTPVAAITTIDGVQTPLVFTTLPQEIMALRNGASLSDISHTAVCKLTGTDAHRFIDRVFPCRVFMKPSQMCQTILIDSNGVICADVYLCRDRDAFFILSRGMESNHLVSWLRQMLSSSEQAKQVGIENLSETNRLFSVNGPFAWEVMAELEEPEIISLPYLHFYHTDSQRTIFRAGETGEFGYHILVANDASQSLWQRLQTIGSGYSLRCAGYEAYACCMLENNFFNIHREGRVGTTAAELQIQWRVWYAKQFAFSEQLAAMQRKPLQRRLTAFFCRSAVDAHASIYCDELAIGFVMHAYPSVAAPGWIGHAMIDIPYACAGVRDYCVTNRSGRQPLQTVSMPCINNRSLYVDPQIHTYRDFASIDFPALNAIAGVVDD